MRVNDNDTNESLSCRILCKDGIIRFTDICGWCQGRSMLYEDLSMKRHKIMESKKYVPESNSEYLIKGLLEKPTVKDIGGIINNNNVVIRFKYDGVGIVEYIILILLVFFLLIYFINYINKYYIIFH
jgi:hypothetical protein